MKSLYFSTSFCNSAIFFTSLDLPITNLKAKPVACSNLQSPKMKWIWIRNEWAEKQFGAIYNRSFLKKLTAQWSRYQLGVCKSNEWAENQLITIFQLVSNGKSITLFSFPRLSFLRNRTVDWSEYEFVKCKMKWVSSVQNYLLIQN